jgi:hypothetical protein
MLDAMSLDSPTARAALAIAVDVALKSTAFLSTAYAAHALLGPRRALARSALWNACLVGLLLLPASTIRFPRLNIPLPWPAAEVARPSLMPTTAPLAPQPVAVSIPIERVERSLFAGPIGPGLPARTIAFAPPEPVSRLDTFSAVLSAYLWVVAMLVEESIVPRYDMGEPPSIASGLPRRR